MDIRQISASAHYVSFSASTITIKDRNTQKTAGMIRGAVRLSNVNNSGRQAFDVVAKLRAAGLDWHKVGLDRVVLHDGEIFLFNDVRILECKNNNRPLYDVDNATGKMDKRLADDAEIFCAARAAGFTVIEYMPFKASDAHTYR